MIVFFMIFFSELLQEIGTDSITNHSEVVEENPVLENNYSLIIEDEQIPIEQVGGANAAVLNNLSEKALELSTKNSVDTIVPAAEITHVPSPSISAESSAPLALTVHNQNSDYSGKT